MGESPVPRNTFRETAKPLPAAVAGRPALWVGAFCCADAGMAKRNGGGEIGGEDLRRLLVAAVVEYGGRKVVGPYTLAIPRRALRVADTEGGRLATLELREGGCWSRTRRRGRRRCRKRRAVK